MPILHKKTQSECKNVHIIISENRKSNRVSNLENFQYSPKGYAQAFYNNILKQPLINLHEI